MVSRIVMTSPSEGPLGEMNNKIYNPKKNNSGKLRTCGVCTVDLTETLDSVHCQVPSSFHFYGFALFFKLHASIGFVYLFCVFCINLFLPSISITLL